MSMGDKVSDFLTALNTHIDNRATDVQPTDGYDSYAGMGAITSEEELRKALYALFNIKE
jgi:hypothetical protein